MPLDDVVIPAVQTALAQLGPAPSGSGKIAGWSVGSTLSIPQSPWCWIHNSSFSGTPAGSDLESTSWEIELMIFQEWAPDQLNAEAVLQALIEPVRQLFRSHIKLGAPTIRSAWVVSGSWGYITVNEVWYRYCALLLTVVEKRGVTTGA